MFSSLSLDILNARIFTAADGRILDVFRISHHGRPEIVTAETKWNKFRVTLDQVLDGRLDVVKLIDSGKPTIWRHKQIPKMSTVINVDNEISDDFTIIEIFTEDRIGVLFTITYTLHQLGLSIHVAKISTNVDQVADVFYVTDETGGKVDDSERVESIRQVLRQTLAPQSDTRERVAEPAH